MKVRKAGCLILWINHFHLFTHSFWGCVKEVISEALLNAQVAGELLSDLSDPVSLALWGLLLISSRRGRL